MTDDRLRRRLELRRSSAASPHRNRTRFHKAGRNDWRRDWTLSVDSRIMDNTIGTEGLSMWIIDSKDLGIVEGFDVRIEITYDEGLTPQDFDECYDEAHLEAWRADSWQFVAAKVVASKRGHDLGEAWLSGLERGYLKDDATEFCDPLVYGAGDFIVDLTDEAVAEAKTELAALVGKA